MTARNKRAFEDAQRLREELRQLLLAHHPLAEPLTAKAIAPMLSRRVSLSAIAWHLRAIRTAHTLQSEQTNSPPDSATLPTVEKREDNVSEPETP